MRVHFNQLTEPIARLVENYHHELIESAHTYFAFQIPPPLQLKSPAPRSRRLQASPPRACGDPIHSA